MNVADQHWYIYILFVSIITLTTQICHKETDSQFHGIAVDCSNADLNSVPQNLPVNTTTLFLTSNNITLLTDKAFKSLIHLKYLDISLNPLAGIQRLAFSGLSSLERLDIIGHKIDYNFGNKSLPSDVFAPLVSLRHLTIRSSMSQMQNKECFPGRIFKYICNLTHLNVDTAPNSGFDTGYSYLTSLEVLTISTITFRGFKFRCGLNSVKNDTFSVFATPLLQTLYLSGCTFWIFENGCLTHFPDLKRFIFRNMTVLENGISSVTSALSIFQNKNMSEVTITHFFGDAALVSPAYVLPMEELSQICLSHLDVSSNQISSIDVNVLLLTTKRPPFTRCIQTINAVNNQITGTATQASLLLLFRFSNLESLDVSIQRVFPFNRFINRHHSAPSKSSGTPVPFFLPSKLQYFNIAGMPFSLGEMSDYFVFHGENLLYLNVSYCGWYNLNHTIIGLINLQVLDISGNDATLLSESFFDHLSTLTTLRMSSVLLDNHFIIEKGKRLFASLAKLEQLDLSFNGLIVIPYDLFDPLKHLKEINLIHNRLTSIPDVSNLNNLKFLYMDFNSLTVIDLGNRQMLDKKVLVNETFRLSIFGNMFSCACEGGEFLQWLMESNVHFDGRNYTCMDMDGRMTYTADVDQISVKRRCSSSFWLMISTSFLSIIFVSLLTTFVIIHNQMKVKLLLLRLIGRQVYPKQREHFLFDAFIAYTSTTLGWVFKDFRQEMEVIRGVKLNLRDRDHLPGGFEAEDVYEAMGNSWKIVLILTDDFLKSTLSYFTMCSCLSSVTLTTPTRLIVIIDSDTQIPSNLHFFLEAVPERNIIYIDFSKPFTGEFWCKVYDLIIV